jgi:hypothetical protein
MKETGCTASESVSLLDFLAGKVLYVLFLSVTRTVDVNMYRAILTVNAPMILIVWEVIISCGQNT